jgi:hypothetical protein
MPVRSPVARSLAFAVLLLHPIATAMAAPACFRPAEIEADEAVRFQAEIMVLSDTCGDRSYTHFASRNRRALAGYQSALIERFRRLGSAHAETAFDSYLTRLSNEASLRDGRETVATLCRQSADLRGKVDRFSEAEFKRYIADRAKERQRDYRRCVD